MPSDTLTNTNILIYHRFINNTITKCRTISVSRQFSNTFRKPIITSYHDNAETSGLFYYVQLFFIDMETKFDNCDAFVRHAIVQEARDVARQISNTGTGYRTTVYF